jgi:hypothetical protein
MYCPGISPEGLRKTTKNFSQNSRSPGRDLNSGLPGNETGVLTSRPRRSAICHGRFHVYNTGFSSTDAPWEGQTFCVAMKIDLFRNATAYRRQRNNRRYRYVFSFCLPGPPEGRNKSFRR